MFNAIRKYGFYVLAGCAGGILGLTYHTSNPADAGGQTVMPPAQPRTVATPDASGADHAASFRPTRRDDAAEPAYALASQCGTDCESLITVLQSQAVVDDESFDAHLSDILSLSGFLQDNVSAQDELIKLAMNAADGNKRDLIIEAFKHLPKEQSEGFAFTLFQSEDWSSRAKGTELLEGHDNISDGDVEAYFDLLGQEKNSYVKQRLIQTLTYSESFARDDQLVPVLNSIMQYSTDGSVRTTALRTKIALAKDPNVLMRDSIYALQSGQESFQLAGLAAFETILKQSKEAANPAHISDADLMAELDRIVTSSELLSDETLPLELLDEVENIYNRYQQEQGAD